MKRVKILKPSPAMAVAFVALVAAVSGSAIALPGKNKVDKNDIRKNAVGPSRSGREPLAAPKPRTTP